METIIDVESTTPAILPLIKRKKIIEQHLDTSPPLDLRVRRKPRSPSPEVTYYHQPVKREPQVPEAPSSTMCFSTSPESRADSESSETSISSDPMREFVNPFSFPPLTAPKITRPFKAYPKVPLTMAMGVATAEAIMGKDSAEAYTQFRERLLSQVSFFVFFYVIATRHLYCSAIYTKLSNIVVFKL